MKKLNEEASATTLVVVVFTSLIFSTIMISWFMLQIYGVTVAGIGLPSGRVGFNSTQDFASNQIDTGTIDTSNGGIWTYQPGVGRVLQQKGYNGWSYLLINNIQPDSNGLIKTRYVINNSVKQDYTIVLRYTGSSDQNEITITNDGIHAPSYLYNVVVASPKVISYPNMNQIENVDISITYDEKLGSANIDFNGQQFDLYNFNNYIGDVHVFGNYYAGAASDTLGFTVKEFYTENILMSTPETDIMAQFGAFVAIALKLVFYNVDPAYLPWELNILLVKTQCIALLVGIINMRSGS